MKDNDVKDNTKQKRVFEFNISYKSLICTAVALLLFAVFMVIFVNKENKSATKTGADVVIMGDSIFAFFTDERSIATVLSDVSGKHVIDVSLGGTGAAYFDKDAKLDRTYDALSFAALTQAVLSRDFRYQENANIRDGATAYFDERINCLEEIDFSQVDYLLIDYMVNDYQVGAPAAAGSDLYDEYSYEGALRKAISSFQDEYPDLTIVLMSAPPSWYLRDEGWIRSDEIDFGGGTIDGYREVQATIADEFGLQLIDLRDEYGDVESRIWYECTYDGVHPTEEYARQIAQKIATELNFL